MRRQEHNARSSYQPTAAERAAATRATDAEARALWIGVLVMFAGGHLTPAERDHYAAMLRRPAARR
jgi:hypothetical protein